MRTRSNEGPAGVEQGPAAVRGLPPRTRCRSFCFLERDGERWTVFLVTYPQEEGDWRGYFLFRSASSGADAPEIRTADLFLEASEAEVDARARGLGRPLVQALLESALDTHERRKGVSEDTRRWFRNLLAEHASGRVPDIGTPSEDLTLAHLRSLYDSYRVDQVAHLISLIDPDEFRALVERLLDGRSIDFRARDRFQLAMIVVQELEKRLPLPPLEVWIQDFLTHRAEYYAYSHALHRGGELP
ncbi:MAG TPA: hypothetical protein VF212_10600 [Longimicrobiales bacterium]